MTIQNYQFSGVILYYGVFIISSPVADEVPRELPIKWFQGRWSPLEVDWGGGGVMSCCHCWLPAWLWGGIRVLRFDQNIFRCTNISWFEVVSRSVILFPLAHPQTFSGRCFLFWQSLNAFYAKCPEFRSLSSPWFWEGGCLCMRGTISSAIDVYPPHWVHTYPTAPGAQIVHNPCRNHTCEFVHFLPQYMYVP